MDIKDFNLFLQTINLNSYRIKYQPIKIVEMDLPKNIQAIQLLYSTYWNDKKLINYDQFYSLYLKTYKKELEEFRKKTQMCKNCFYLGLPARIYRTWASIITQIHAAYIAESVFTHGTVEMSAELDHQGADIKVTYKEKILNFQVKKESFSREVRVAKSTKNKIPGLFVELFYKVPAKDVFTNPKTKKGEFRKPYLDFIKNKALQRFPNGFVVFTPVPFLKVKEQVDKGGLNK